MATLRCPSIAPDKPLKQEGENYKSARQGILIVDDDATIRAMLGIFCRQQGFPFWLAENGAAAIDEYRRHADEIALVLLDIRMPGRDGPDTYAELKQIDPQVACCFMSSDWDPYSEEELLEMGAVGLMVKPFLINNLAHAVRDWMAHA
jgi:CheY-like chemotaxis protein